MRQRGDRQFIDLLNQVRVAELNQNKLQLLTSKFIAKHNYIIPKNIPATKIDQVLRRNRSETEGLAGILKTKLNAQVMLTVKIDLQGKLINGNLDTLKHISKDRRNGKDVRLV